jgi:nitroreductase
MTELALYEALQTTRAVRKLRPDPIPDEVLRRVLQAATWAPSGGNRQPWRIIVVRAAETKRVFSKLYQAAWSTYSAPLRAAIGGLPMPARSKAEKNLAASDYMAEHLHEAPIMLTFCFDPRLLAITDAKLGRPSVVGGASIYPAVQNTLLACRAEGLGCVITTMLCQFEPQLRPLLGLPEPWALACFVPIGYPVGRGHGAPVSRQPVDQMAFSERFGQALSR